MSARYYALIEKLDAAEEKRWRRRRRQEAQAAALDYWARDAIKPDTASTLPTEGAER